MENSKAIHIDSLSALFDGNGQLINESTKEFLTSFLEAFEKWVDANVKV